MRGSTRRRVALTAFALAYLVFQTAASLAADAPWWNDAWKFRRRLRPQLNTTPRPNVAWARFSIPQGCAPDGRDVRVIGPNGQPVSSSVRFFDPGIYGVVAFELQSGGGEYWLYMGNPRARNVKAWEPKAGVFLETFRRRGGNGANWKVMQHTIKRASDFPFGAGYRPRIYDGYNPYGEPDNFVSIYTAWFHVPRKAEYLFATISDEASFLLVDGKMVAQWPGYHSAYGGRRGEHRGKVTLSAGAHELKYYHVDFRGAQTMLAAWRPAGSRKLEPMPASAFVPIAGCYVDELEARGDEAVVDFRAEQVEWLELDEYTYLINKFHDVSTVGGGEGARREWKFSDGTSYTGDPVDKLFMHKGTFRVTLTVTAGGRKYSTTRPVKVFPIDKMERADIYDLTFQFLKAIKTTPLNQLQTSDLLAAAHLLRDQRHLAEAVQVYRDYLEQKFRAEGKLDIAILREVLAVSADGYGKFQQLEKYVSGLLAHLKQNAPERADVYYLLGRLQLDDLNAPERALTSFQSARLALGQSSDTALQRQVWIALGDAHRKMGKTDEARKAYVKAQEIPLPNETPHDYDVSSYALTAEAYIRKGHLDEARDIIDEWERKFPTEKLVGYSSILKARVMARSKKRRQATDEIEAFLATKPQGVFLQNALLELGDIYAQMGRTRQARETYERLLKEFETQENREAVQEKLRKLGRN